MSFIIAKIDILPSKVAVQDLSEGVVMETGLRGVDVTAPPAPMGATSPG